MAPLLKINSLDLSSYLAVQPEDGFDPVDAGRIEPQFSGAPALREGLEFVQDSVGNREWTVPLILTATTRAALHDLVEQIQNELDQGALVQFATDAADDPTWFILQRGLIDVSYNYFHSVNALARARMQLWTEPHGSTGTSRLVASVFGGTNPVQLTATGLIGDVTALGNLAVRVGSAQATGGRVVAFGFHPHASFNGYFHVASLSDKVASTLNTGMATAVGSTFVNIPKLATRADYAYLFRAYLTPPEAFVGRHRVYLIAQNKLNRSGAMYVNAVDRFNAALGATVNASQNDVRKYQLIDLGEVQVQGRASGQEPVPTQYVEVRGGPDPVTATSNAFAHASGYGLGVQALFLVPMQSAPGVLRTYADDSVDTLWAADSAPYQSYFWNGVYMQQFGAAPEQGTLKYSYPVGTSAWAYFYGGISLLATAGGAGFGVQASAGATGFLAIGSGAAQSNTTLTVNHWLNAASQVASGNTLELWSQTNSHAAGALPSLGTRAVLTYGPSANMALSLLSASANGATAVLASTTLAGNATAILGGNNVTFSLTTNTDGSASALLKLSATNVSFSVAGSHVNVQANSGWAGIYHRYGAQALSIIDNVYYTSRSLGSGIANSPREEFRFESYPQRRAVQGNASVFKANRAAEYRGVAPELLPVGSGAATQQLRGIVFEGDIADFQGGNVVDVSLYATERFTFLR